MAQQHDFEDVLSSIRRLVANESGTKVTDKAAGDGPALVLNDSHRVTEPEDPFQMIRALAQEERDGRDAEHLTNALPERLAAITTDLAEASEPAPWDTDEDALSEAVNDPREGLSAPDAQPDAVIADRTEDVPADYAEDTDYEAATEQADYEGTTEDTAPEQEINTESDVSRSDFGRDEFQYRHHPRTTSEPNDSAGQPDLSSPEPEESRQEPDRAGLADLSSSLDGDEALRDLIAEIVRQELSGELGERITRNVRKLVRREIRQVLASDEID